MRLLIAGGGTGGHIYPALAVVRSLRALAPAADVAWLGGHRGLEAAIVPGAGLPLRRLPLRSLRSAGRDLHLVLDPIRLALAIPVALGELLRRRPAAILSTGGYVAIPVLLAARLLRVPSVLWEGNVVPGRSARLVARWASVLAVSHAETAEAFGHARVRVTGTPIRATSGTDREAARARVGAGPGDRVLLVFGGSQAVRRLNAAVAGALPALVERVRIVHVTGPDGIADALAARDALPPGLRDRYRPAAFLHDEMADALAAADLALGRAGASTLAEAAAFGLPLVIVPYPHAAGHQRRNAEVHAAGGAALLVEDAALTADRLLEVTTLLLEPARHVAMVAAARAAARPGAADAVALLVDAVARRAALPDAARIEAVARGDGA